MEHIFNSKLQRLRPENHKFEVSQDHIALGHTLPQKKSEGEEERREREEGRGERNKGSSRRRKRGRKQEKEERGRKEGRKQEEGNICRC